MCHMPLLTYAMPLWPYMYFPNDIFSANTVLGPNWVEKLICFKLFSLLVVPLSSQALYWYAEFGWHLRMFIFVLSVKFNSTIIWIWRSEFEWEIFKRSTLRIFLRIFADRINTSFLCYATICICIFFLLWYLPWASVLCPRFR